MVSALDLDHWTGRANFYQRLDDLERRVEDLERGTPSGLFDGTMLQLPGSLELLRFSPEIELTINGGVIAITQGYHSIETEGAAGTDDLDTINGGTVGDVLILRAADSAHTVVCKDATGNLRLPADRSLDNVGDVIVLFYTGLTWLELSFSDNS